PRSPAACAWAACRRSVRKSPTPCSRSSPTRPRSSLRSMTPPAAATPCCAASRRPTRARNCPDLRCQSDRRHEAGAKPRPLLIGGVLGVPVFRTACPQPKQDAGLKTGTPRDRPGTEERMHGKARDLQKQMARHRLHPAAALPDLHLLLLARQPGALLGLHPAA